MKLLILFVVVGLLAALSSAQPIDSPAHTQPETSGVQRFKRQAILINGMCAENYARVNKKCVHCDKYEDLTGWACPGRLKHNRLNKYY